MDSNEDCEACWICLEGVEGIDISPGPLHGNRLIKPCRCPRVVHSVCLAKWQLSQSGRSEEKFCRFCKERLPDWQANLALPGMGAVEPVMSVHFNGQTHMVKVKPGEEGRVAFIQDVRRLLRLRENQEFSITFECKVPGHGMFLDLKGLSSYDAAVFCAAMTAVERQRLAAQKANKAAYSSRGGGGTSSLLPTSVPAAAGLLSGGAATTANSSASGNSSRSSGGNSGSETGGSDSAGSSSAATTYTSTASGPTSNFFASSHAITPAITPSRPRTMPGLSVDVLEPDSNEVNSRMRLASVTSIGVQASRLPDANGDAVTGEASTAPSVSSALSGSAQPGCAAHGPSFAGPVDAALSQGDDSVASPGVDGAAHAGGGRSIGAPPAASYQDQSGGGLRPPSVPRGCGVSTAYDSACEVEPGIAGGEEPAVNAAEADVSSPAATARHTHGRYKFFLCHSFRDRPVLGGSSNSSSSSSSTQPPVPGPLPIRHGSECSGGGTWLTRLLLCASFGSSNP
ncbi:hypothetical protein Vretimale_2719 [Volvox reticuliferus]|uniref:Uncharacterized protein n=1 Tax=Volvox reticuliferus TaxID=1737510 RepID=A0A8J4D772_9CHLO|nr:hypothetical protein Vretifemale_1972 [Volvox reticuliferus]GIL96993.1 hypothetical protein Vretimale_2719 [Volvox reticuliferus]